MVNDRLNKEKEELLAEIMTQRDELKVLSEQINNIGGSVSFINFFIIPLVVAAVVAFSVKAIGVSGNGGVGAFIMSFVVAMAASTIINKKKIKKRKEELIKKRVEIQSAIVKNSQRLAELDKGHSL